MDDTGDANPANKLLTESGKRSVLNVKTDRIAQEMSYLALTAELQNLHSWFDPTRPPSFLPPNP